MKQQLLNKIKINHRTKIKEIKPQMDNLLVNIRKQNTVKNKYNKKREIKRDRRRNLIIN
jgi:hypothetical protein